MSRIGTCALSWMWIQLSEICFFPRSRDIVTRCLIRGHINTFKGCDDTAPKVVIRNRDTILDTIRVNSASCTVEVLFVCIFVPGMSVSTYISPLLQGHYSTVVSVMSEMILYVVKTGAVFVLPLREMRPKKLLLQY